MCFLHCTTHFYHGTELLLLLLEPLLLFNPLFSGAQKLLQLLPVKLPQQKKEERMKKKKTGKFLMLLLMMMKGRNTHGQRPSSFTVRLRIVHKNFIYVYVRR